MKKFKYDENYYYFLHDNKGSQNSEFYFNNDFICMNGNDLAKTFYGINLKRDSSLLGVNGKNNNEILSSIVKKYQYYCGIKGYCVVVLKIPKKYFFSESIRPIWKKENIKVNNNYVCYSIPKELVYGFYDKEKDRFIFNDNYNEKIDFNGRVYNCTVMELSQLAENSYELEKLRAGFDVVVENEWRKEKTYEELVEYDHINNTFYEEKTIQKYSALNELKRIRSDLISRLNQTIGQNVKVKKYYSKK